MLYYNFQPVRLGSHRYTCEDKSRRASWATGPRNSCGTYRRKSDAARQCDAYNAAPISGHVMRQGRWELVVFADDQELNAAS